MYDNEKGCNEKKYSDIESKITALHSYKSMLSEEEKERILLNAIEELAALKQYLFPPTNKVNY